MDAILPLWEFAPALKTKLMYLAMVAQMMIAIYCYRAMSKARVAAVRAKRITPDEYKSTASEPEDLRALTRAVANQFEMPVLFYALLLATLTAGSQSWITVILAWSYVVLRGVHAGEMISSNNVMRRRRVFIRSAQVLLLIMVEFVLAVLFWIEI